MNILILEPDAFPTIAREKLSDIGNVLLGDCPDPSSIQAIFVRLGQKIDADFHKDYSSLEWIVSPTTGLNHIDLEHFERSGVAVLSLRGRVEFLDQIHATAEHTLALALALLRKIPDAVQAVRNGKWDRYPFKGRELHGKTVFILGYGRVGRQVHKLYAAFGCRVIAFDKERLKVPDDIWCPLDQGLESADILSVHLSLNETTEGFISEELLSQLRPNCILVNTSRGEVICQQALMLALLDGRLAAAALDVLRDEPAPLIADVCKAIDTLGARLLITPHIAGFTHESLECVEAYITDRFIDAILAESSH